LLEWKIGYRASFSEGGILHLIRARTTLSNALSGTLVLHLNLAYARLLDLWGHGASKTTDHCSLGSAGRLQHRGVARFLCLPTYLIPIVYNQHSTTSSFKAPLNSYLISPSAFAHLDRRTFVMAVNIDPEEFEYEAVTQPVPKARVAGMATRSGLATEVPMNLANEMQITKEGTKQELSMIKVPSSTTARQ
jgi:hypothetical protein